jgi:hypothetical protein
MRSGPIVVLAPLLALAEQAIAFALVPFACAAQWGAWLHGVPALFFLAGLLIAIAATRLAAGVPAERALFPRLAAGMAWLSLLALIMLWLPMWVLEPCQQ